MGGGKVGHPADFPEAQTASRETSMNCRNPQKFLPEVFNKGVCTCCCDNFPMQQRLFSVKDEAIVEKAGNVVEDVVKILTVERIAAWQETALQPAADIDQSGGDAAAGAG